MLARYPGRELARLGAELRRKNNVLHNQQSNRPREETKVRTAQIKLYTAQLDDIGAKPGKVTKNSSLSLSGWGMRSVENECTRGIHCNIHKCNIHRSGSKEKCFALLTFGSAKDTQTFTSLDFGFGVTRAKTKYMVTLNITWKLVSD